MYEDLLTETKIEDLESTIDIAKDLIDMTILYCDEYCDGEKFSKIYSVLEVTSEKLHEALKLASNCKDILMR